MLTEDEVRERAQYCCCVFLQLSWLYGNPRIPPGRYLEVLGGSSLDLAADPFVEATLQEAGMRGDPDGGLPGLIHLYEGFVHALCEVLETDMGRLVKTISSDFVERLAVEVGLEGLSAERLLKNL